MLESLLGSKTRENILIYLLARNEGYAREIAKYYNTNLSPVQNQLERLENGNIIAGRQLGRTRLYTFNSRYPFLNELKNLLNKVIKFLPEKEKQKLVAVRTRPRRKNKPL